MSWIRDECHGSEILTVPFIPLQLSIKIGERVLKFVEKEFSTYKRAKLVIQEQISDEDTDICQSDSDTDSCSIKTARKVDERDAVQKNIIS